MFSDQEPVEGSSVRGSALRRRHLRGPRPADGTLAFIQPDRPAVALANDAATFRWDYTPQRVPFPVRAYVRPLNITKMIPDLGPMMDPSTLFVLNTSWANLLEAAEQRLSASADLPLLLIQTAADQHAGSATPITDD